MARSSSGAAELFEKTSTYIPGRPAVPGYRITCCKCGATEKVTTSTGGVVMAPQGIAAKFRNLGWSVGARRSKDLCPKCARGGNKPAKEEPMANQSNVVDMTISKAEPPREMSKQDKRIVIAKLEEVYVDEKTGYDNGWTDARVAGDLGVPRDWVRLVREELFGVECANDESREILSQAQQLLGEARKIHESVKSSLEEATTLQAKRISERRQLVAEMGQKIEIFSKKLDQTLKALGK